VAAFFQKHRCGEICQALGLRKDHHLREPTHILEIPAHQSCVDALPKFVQIARRTAHCNSVAYPRQIARDREWLEVKIWAASKNGDKAKQLLKEQLEALYEELREVFPLRSRPNWSVEEWQEKLEGWRTASGACIIPYPPDWTNAGIQQLWIFSEKNSSGWIDHRNSRWAMNQIAEDLSQLGTSDSQAETEGVAEADAQATGEHLETSPWSKNCDSKGNVFWLRQSDSLWFWEGDEKWQRFLDDQSNRFWWWNSDTGNWFYEPPEN